MQSRLWMMTILLWLSCTFPSIADEARIGHHDLDVTLDPPSHRIQATDRVTIEMPDAKQTVEFYLSKTLDQVELIDAAGMTLKRIDVPDDTMRSPEHENGTTFTHWRVTADMPEPIFRFVLSYSGSIYDSLKSDESNYARGFATTSGLICEQGIYLAKSSGWFPAQDQGTMTFTLKTHLPSGWHSISQGEEVARVAKENGQFTEWICDDPMDDIYLIAGRYIITEEDHHGVRVMTYTYQDEPELSANYRNATKKYLDMYKQLIGPYAFEKFALVENFWQTGYGMPSFTLLGSQVIRLPFIINVSYGHEILHNWWGNGVFVDWERGNWCEGITNYMADHYYKKLSGQDKGYRRSMLQNYQNYVKSERDFPLTEFRERHNPASQAIGYNKSAMTYHMLHELLGEAKFNAAWQSFYRNYLFKAVSWAEIESEFSRQTGEDLKWFFSQWIERKGAPNLKIARVDISRKKSGYQVSLTLMQDEPTYKMRIPIRFTGAADSTIYVFMNEKSGKFKFQFKDKPKKIHLDPDFDIFRMLDRDEIPPALSQTLGATNILLILPEDEGEAKVEFYGRFSKMLSMTGAATVLRDGESTEADLKGKTLCVLGGKNRWLSQVKSNLPAGVELGEQAWTIAGKTFPVQGHAFVLTMRHPTDPGLSMSIIQIDHLEDFPAIERKLPHYGGYGYLVFKGADNVLKGEWETETSPLIYHVAD